MDNATSGTLPTQAILIAVLIAAAVWALIELALLLRKTRRTVGDLTQSVSETIGQIQPILSKVDATIDELQPTVADVQPLVEKVELAVDEANVSLAKINGILGDVSEMSETATSVTNTVKSATAAAASSVAGIVDRMSGGARRQQPAIEAPSAAEAAEPSDENPAHASARYITYEANKVTAEGAAWSVGSSPTGVDGVPDAQEVPAAHGAGRSAADARE